MKKLANGQQPSRPPILKGAVLLAALSVIWSGYAITDLMDSGPFGLSVALAGDIGWITVLWAEYRGIAVAGRRWVAPAAGWAIAAAVGVLLVLHGREADSAAQAIAGPFVVLIGKAVWTFALAAMRDPAALTPDQEAEIHAVMRETAFIGRMHQAELERIDREADAEIARIRAQARTRLAQDDADFEISLERMNKHAEIQRRTPLALAHNPAPIALAPSEPNTPSEPNATAEQTSPAPITEDTPSLPARENSGRSFDRTEPITPNSQHTIADLVREQIRRTPNNTEAIEQVMQLRPNANRDSVAASVRRERRKQEMRGGYA